MIACQAPNSNGTNGKPPRPRRWIPLSLRMFVAMLVLLNGLTSLRGLALNNSRVTDAGLEHLRALPTLRALRLDNTHVTDAGLAHIKDLPQLDHLFLIKTWVTDAGLSQLQGLSGLRC